MLILMQAQATEEQVRAVCKEIEQSGCNAHPVRGTQRVAIGVTGRTVALDSLPLDEMAGVVEVFHLTKPYKLVSRDFQPQNTIISFPDSDARVGGEELMIIAGPCSVESREQILAIGERVAAQGVRFFRGGAFKPRTSPYSFQGLGLEGLKLLAEVRDRFGLLIVTEAIDEASLEAVQRYADVVQIGSRNMQNFPLLKLVGRVSKPVLLKRGMSATAEEYLLAAEYIVSEGNHQVILCERGIRSFGEHSRNTLDLNVIPAIHKLSHLPIIVDPSHGTGRREQVIPLARAAVAAGCDGLIVEVHNIPEHALSDGDQALYPGQFDELMLQIRQFAALLGRTVPHPAQADSQTMAVSR
jgi:3-deoxy-7-phosphoheptulonate synthase